MDEGQILSAGSPHEMLVAPQKERLQASLARFRMSLAMHRDLGRA